MESTKEYREDNIVDAFTKTVITLPEEHYLIHAGKLWEAIHSNDSVASGSSIEMLIHTSNTRNLLHALFTFSSSLAAQFYVYEDTEKVYVISTT